MTKKTINLCLGVHNHQPVGNFDHVLAEACEKCYLPFFQVLERFPKVKFSVHFTGYLLHWIAKNYPEVISVMDKLHARGQIELVTGGFYEPIMAIIPDCDKVGQIRKLTAYLEKLFCSKQANKEIIDGMWLAERVWEPHLPKPLVEAGIKYVCVDDSHFRSVGLHDSELYRCYVTEEDGNKLDIFPINQNLRYMIPFETPEKIIEYLKSIATSEGDAGAFYFDDGEKFGVWPHTYESVYKDGWLEKFFTILEKNSDWIHIKTFGEYNRTIGPSGRVYLPTASYAEMMEWALPADRAAVLEDGLHKVDELYKPFLKGGFWRNFLVKYPEGNQLHKKMLHASKRLQKLRASGKVDESQLLDAQDKIWQAQSNDPFWHGVFGGLYLTNLRTANFQAAVAADVALDALEQKIGLAPKGISVETFDIDLDGFDEVVIRGDKINACLAPHYGGALLELDYKPRPFNLTDTLSRRKEPYHEKLKQAQQKTEDDHEGAKTIHGQVVTKEANLSDYLAYDWYRRLSFLDHFLGSHAKLKDLATCHYPEQGDFVHKPYKVVSTEASGNKAQVRLERDGHIWFDHKHRTLNVSKIYSFDYDTAQMKVAYQLTNTSDEPISLWFAPEMNFNFLAPDASDRYFFELTGEKCEPAELAGKDDKANSDGIGIADEWLGIKVLLKWSQKARMWRYPVFSVSNSESGFERIYQGSAIVPNWHVDLKGREKFEVEIYLTVGGL